MLESASAFTVTAPPASTSEWSISASNTLPPLLPIWLTENAAPKARPAAAPEVLRPTEAAMLPAPAWIADASLALSATAPAPSCRLLSRTTAAVCRSMKLTEPEPAPDAATPLPWVPLAALTAPATV